MERKRPQWYLVKEDDPLKYAVHLNDLEYEEVHGYCLQDLNHYTEWIKHLMGEEHPPEDVERPSELTLHSYWAAHKAAKTVAPRNSSRKLRLHSLRLSTSMG